MWWIKGLLMLTNHKTIIENKTLLRVGVFSVNIELIPPIRDRVLYIVPNPNLIISRLKGNDGEYEIPTTIRCKVVTPCKRKTSWLGRHGKAVVEERGENKSAL